MAQYRFIHYTASDGLATIAIDRPPYNMLDIPTMEEINGALEVVVADHGVRVLVLTGAGEKAFSAGVEVADHTPDKVDRMIEVFHGIFRRLQQVNIPVIAALNGVALGGGCELAIACDMIVAAPQAKIGQPEIRLAVFPPVAAILLPRLLPPAKAMELLLGGASIDAAEAASLGLVNRVFPRESFAADTRAFAEPFLALSRAALACTKKAIREAAGKPFGAALASAERIYLDDLMSTADAKEGLTAFLEKRKPVWTHG